MIFHGSTILNHFFMTVILVL